MEGNNKFLLPTAETALVNFHRNEILKESDLPRKYFAYTPCYRQEAGSYRTEERGMIRGYQFNKVEIVQYTTEEGSDKAFEEMKYCDDKNYDWDKSLPRKWIYNSFFHNALSVKQQDRVLFTDSEAAFGSNCDISDKAFILSKKEFDDYRDFIIKNKLHYCCDKKLRECNWWLRANEEYSRKFPFHVIAGSYTTIGKSKEDLKLFLNNF